jgi:hypothetical protein
MSTMIGSDSKLLFVIVILILVLMFMFVMPVWGRDQPCDSPRESGEAMIGSNRVKGDCFFYADGERHRRVLEAVSNEIQ